jgi:carboxymethylenebutenolidase
VVPTCCTSGIVPTFHLYPADHAFFNEARPVYHAESATKAWERALTFLAAQLAAAA